MKREEMYCQLCGKRPQIGYNRPKSLHKTQRLVLPNLQKWNGLYICSRCRKTIAKHVATVKAA